MKVIIAGSRTIREYAVIEAAIVASGFDVTEVVSGSQRTYDKETHTYYGADYFGEQWAMMHNVPVFPFPADWDIYGKAAGPIRNEAMAIYGEALVSVRQGGNASRGTTDMIAKARLKDLLVFVWEVEDHPTPSPIPAYTVTPEGRCVRLVLADGRTGLFASERDAHADAARLAAVDRRGVWGLVRGYANKERR